MIAGAATNAAIQVGIVTTQRELRAADLGADEERVPAPAPRPAG
jgi:hypothetical protein